MGTEVLRPHDCLIRIPPAATFSRRRSYYGNCYNNYASSSNNFYGAGSVRSHSHRKPATRPEQRKRSAVERRPSSDDSKVARGSGFVMEKVMILRRGESLDSKMNIESLKKECDDLVVIGTQRLGPDPEMVPKQIRIMDLNVYAGSAFAMSPSPSALPFPSFQRKQGPSTVVVDDSATRDLRRLLRLE